MALDKLTLLDETIINNTATSVATTVVNNSAQTNYISFPVATANPLSNGWRVYSDGASTSPVDGTGGSPNTTLTQNTSSPLNSTGDFRITKTTGASRQGEGISTDFTIANRHLAKVLQISFDYEVVTGSTLANDDLRVYIIANPTVTPVVIEPVNVSIQGVLSGTRVRHLATFQTDFTITTYRLCIHIATTTSSNQNIDFNNFRVWEQSQTIGAIITDWVNYTPTFSSANGFATTPTSINFISRRNGSALEIMGSFIVNTTNSNTARIPLGFQGVEGNVTVDSSKLLSTSMVGRAVMRQNVPQGYIYNVLATGGNNYMEFAYAQNGSTEPFNAMAGSSFQSGVSGRVQIQATIPIAGWGSSVAMSSDTGDSRVVACQVTGLHTGGGSDGIIIFPTVVRDTHGTYSVSTGRYTVPVTGFYRIGGLITGTNTGITARLWIDGSPQYRIGTNNVTTAQITVIGFAFLNAGQIIDVRPTSALGNAGASDGYLSIERISAGSQVIATSETVSARYTTDTAQNNDVIKCEDKDFDTHNAYSITTGKYTVPMSGVYRISGQITNYNSGYLYADIRKNNDVIICRDLIQLSSASYMTASPNLVTKLIAGDTVWLWAYTSGTMQVDTGYRNMFCIERIGL